MGDFVKKQTSIFYLNLVNLILVLCGLTFSILSSTGSYKISKINIVIYCVMIAVVLNLVLLAMDNKIRGKVSFDIGRLLIIILISIVLSIMIIERAELMGYIYFSDLEKGNPIAVASMNNAVVSWVFYGLVLLISVVGGFLKVKKD